MIFWNTELIWFSGEGVGLEGGDLSSSPALTTEIRCLWPNHFLSILGRKQWKIWPRKCHRLVHWGFKSDLKTKKRVGLQRFPSLFCKLWQINCQIHLLTSLSQRWWPTKDLQLIILYLKVSLIKAWFQPLNWSCFQALKQKAIFTKRRRLYPSWHTLFKNRGRCSVYIVTSGLTQDIDHLPGFRQEILLAVLYNGMSVLLWTVKSL